MERIIDIFKQIQATNSLNEKKSILVANKDNELFTQCLKFLLDTNIVTGISDKKLAKKIKPTNTYHLREDSTFTELS